MGLSVEIQKKYNIVHHSDYDDIIVFRNFDNKYGVLNVKNGFLGFKKYSIIIEPIYIYLNYWIINNEKLFSVTKEDNLCVLLSFENKLILDFEYVSIQCFPKDFKLLVKNKKKELLLFDYCTRNIEQLSFDHVLPPRSNTYGAPTGKNYFNYKSIINSIETDIDTYDTDILNYIGKWGITDSSFNTIISNKYDYIDFLRNQNHFKIAIGSPTFEDEDDYLILKNMKWGIIDGEEKIVLPCNYDWVEEINNNLYAVNIGGELYFDDEYQVDMWSIKGGKWGVYNSDNKLIVPIVYDKIFLSWYQVKGYIFVQNEGIDYDVFTFQGEKIMRNKPNYKDYI